MWPFSRKNDDDTDERPPKPEPKERSETYTEDRLAVTIEYRNGDTERVECYGWEYNDGYVVLYTEPYPRTGYSRESVSLRYRKRNISEEVLARDPVQTPIGTDEITTEWVKDYKWKRGWGIEKGWRPHVKDAFVSIEYFEDSDD